MKRSNWQNRPKPSICPHSIRNYGFNQFLERIRSWPPSNSALRCQECEKEEMGKSSKKTKKVTIAFGDKFLWVCLECNQIFCGAENLRWPDSHICSHAIKNNHMFAIPIAAWCLACKSIHQIMTMETNKELEINKELDSAINKERIGGCAARRVYNLACDYVVRPLQNLGNTCFFNAILQNLLCMRDLRAHFQQLDCQPQSVSDDLCTLFLDTDDILEDDVDSIDHTDLFNSICRWVPSFRGHQEHDSHELLRQLFSLLLAEGTSFIRGIFGGKLSSTVSSALCGYDSKSYEPFLDLSLAIPSNEWLNERSTKNNEVSAPRDPVPSAMEFSSYPSMVPPNVSSRKRPRIEAKCFFKKNVDLSSQFSDVKPNVSSRKRPRIEGQTQGGNNNGDPLSIEKCLDLFIAPEFLYDDEYFCDHCSNRSIVHLKRYLIFKAPPVLTIHLKRFTRDTNGIIKKINSHVNIQELLDLTPYMDPSCEDKEKPYYWLIGMVEHVGASLKGGHYVAYVKGIRSRGQELAWFRIYFM